MKSGRSAALNPDKLGMQCKTNKRSDTETKAPGVLPIYQSRPIGFSYNNIHEKRHVKLVSQTPICLVNALVLPTNIKLGNPYSFCILIKRMRI